MTSPFWAGVALPFSSSSLLSFLASVPLSLRLSLFSLFLFLSLSVSCLLFLFLLSLFSSFSPSSFLRQGLVLLLYTALRRLRPRCLAGSTGISFPYRPSPPPRRGAALGSRASPRLPYTVATAVLACALTLLPPLGGSPRVERASAPSPAVATLALGPFFLVHGDMIPPPQVTASSPHGPSGTATSSS